MEADDRSFLELSLVSPTSKYERQDTWERKESNGSVWDG